MVLKIGEDHKIIPRYHLPLVGRHLVFGLVTAPVRTRRRLCRSKASFSSGFYRTLGTEEVVVVEKYTQSKHINKVKTKQKARGGHGDLRCCGVDVFFNAAMW